MRARIVMRNLPRSGRNPSCRSAQDTRAAIRNCVSGASPEIGRLGSLAGRQQVTRRQWLGPAGMPNAGWWVATSAARGGEAQRALMGVVRSAAGVLGTRLIRIEPGCWAAYLLWIWPRVPFAIVTHCGLLLPSPM